MGKSHKISIHALREEGDLGRLRGGPAASISIHALREEGDCLVGMRGATKSKFLSTPSARRATPYPDAQVQGRKNFYPRPPRGGRPKMAKVDGTHIKISIHALREEGDDTMRTMHRVQTKFLSTPSARRATYLGLG